MYNVYGIKNTCFKISVVSKQCYIHVQHTHTCTSTMYIVSVYTYMYMYMYVKNIHNAKVLENKFMHLHKQW